MSIEQNSAPASPSFLSFVGNATALQVSQDFIERLPVAIYACDADGRILWFNSLAATLWGRAPLTGDDSERYCGSYRLYIGGQQIRRNETPMAAVLRTGIPMQGAEIRVERPDGSSVWAMVHIEPVEDETGKLIGAINCFHETTALHNAKEDLSKFFENGAVGLHVLADNGTILRANQAELAMLGYAESEYVGCNIRDYHLDQSVAGDILDCLRNHRPIRQYPARLHAKDGSVRHVLITSNGRVRDRGTIGTRCFMIDVTDRAAAEALLHEQERRLATTYEHAGSGIAEIDADGRLLRVNLRLCELMDLTADQLIGRSIFDEAFSQDVEHDREQFRRQVAGTIDRYSVEKRVSRKDGSFFWTSVTSSSVRDADGRFLYAVRVQHDISERKQVQEELAARIQEQAALYRLTDRLQHARSLGDVYELALDAIQEALRCQRSSILLYDSASILQFVAWRGLSDAYRAAVEGHSPWKANEENPQPIYIADIRQAALPEVLKNTILAEGIRAIAFIPLMDSGKLLGKFMAYFDQPHVFMDGETDVALALAHQLGFGIERMRAQKAAQHLVSIVESSHDAIVSKNLDGIITTWNRSAERLFGYTADEVVGKSITIIIPPDRMDEETEILRRIRTGEMIDHLETVRRRKDGSLVDISLTISPVRDAKGRIVGASKIARDITERKEAETKIRASEQQLQDLLAAIPTAIYTTDPKGKITYFNQAAVDFAGRVPKLGSDRWCISPKLYWPDGTPLPHDKCPMAVALQEKRAVRGVEAVAERPDGTRVPFIPHPTPIYDADGNIVGGINMLVDISERKQAETQQRMLLNELNHRVKNNMQMLQSLLSSAARRSQSEEARHILEDATGRISAMAAAQRVLYDTIDATRFSLPQFLDAVCVAVQQTLPSYAKITRKADAGELPNDAAMPLALIINELVTNAFKHGGTGDAELNIRVSLLQEGDADILSVEDDGPGFELNSVRHRSSGLRLVEGLARQLGATFAVSSGSTTRCSVAFSRMAER
ncbi:PAS domain S-box protein [Rhizobium leucaenae]|uniref:histidine kinase n=2 Tax=Rhizobium leucaenae TaxID=29450 RepID=A0A7W6ZUA3_9HYPH|nr:PAS domain S-box protein [Rhizobium leucaenae]MBB4568881.1 PAS domain S-box-containing protein [Rhizobium leucaenae]MBB6302042.1 PAS domain S-box-containing protein [Rhizobium leucaenae]